MPFIFFSSPSSLLFDERGRRTVSDPEHLPVPPEQMLTEDYLKKRRSALQKVTDSQTWRRMNW